MQPSEFAVVLLENTFTVRPLADHISATWHALQHPGEPASPVRGLLLLTLPNEAIARAVADRLNNALPGIPPSRWPSDAWQSAEAEMTAFLREKSAEAREIVRRDEAGLPLFGQVGEAPGNAPAE